MLGARSRSLARSLITTVRRVPLLSRLRLADDSAAFCAAGFSMGPGLNIGGVEIELISPGERNAWAWKDGIGSSNIDVDGIATEIEGFEILGQSLDYTRTEPHRNQASALYSVSVSTPDLQRTVDAMSASLGAPRKVASPSPFSTAISMAFFKLGSPSGPVIVEGIAPTTPGTAVELPGLPSIAADRDVPASIVGMVVVAPVLDHLPKLLGADCVGNARPAMQGEGRMIAPVRRGQLGLGLSLAFMTPPNQAALQARAKKGAGVGLSSVLSTAG